jgi:hypothetical protein
MRFPETDCHISNPDNAVASFRMSSADKTFLTKTLPKLPCDDYNHPCTVDLNGAVVIRASVKDQPQPTELILSGATITGEPSQFNCNRKFLVRAARLGFDNVHFFNSNTPILCTDQRRSYVFAPLSSDDVVYPTKDAVRIESSRRNDRPTIPRQPKQRSSTKTMTQTKTKSNGQARTDGAKPPSSNGKVQTNDVTALLEQAEAVKALARDTLTKTSELIAALKQHRKRNRIVQSTLSSLRQLKAIGA